MKSCGLIPRTNSPTTVGIWSSTDVIILVAASRSTAVRSFAASSSRSKARGRYSSSNRIRSRSASWAVGTGWESNGASRCWRRSFRMRSSWAVAMALRGPTRTQIWPLARTGGASEGWTIITATALPARMRLVTDRTGGGSVFPSVLMSDSRWSRRSVISMPVGIPSSSTPTKTTPARPWPGRSFANAQTAWRIFSMGLSFLPPPPASELLRSTSSDSMSVIMASSSRSE